MKKAFLDVVLISITAAFYCLFLFFVFFDDIFFYFSEKSNYALFLGVGIFLLPFIFILIAEYCKDDSFKDSFISTALVCFGFLVLFGGAFLINAYHPFITLYS